MNFEKCSLPIQGGIADNNAVDWDGGKLNPLQAVVAASVGDIVSGGDISNHKLTLQKIKLKR